MSLRKSLENFYEDVKNDPEFIAEDLILRITEKISRIMKDKNISKSELAERLNTSKAYITKLLNGNPNMTVMTISKLSAVLGEEIINIPLAEKFEWYEFFTSEDTWVEMPIEQERVPADSVVFSMQFNNEQYNREELLC